jgi:hypothetical protein
MLSRARARKFLERLVNLPDDYTAAERLAKAFPDMLQPSAWRPARIAEVGKAARPAVSEDRLLAEQQIQRVFRSRDLLRVLWSELDHRTRNYRLFMLQRDDLIQVDASLGMSSFLTSGRQLPAPSVFEEALLHLSKSWSVCRICQNSACDTSRYFFAEKPRQKYCSSHCAEHSRRIAKLEWWRQHGEQWRQLRQQQQGENHGKAKRK